MLNSSKQNLLQFPDEPFVGHASLCFIAIKSSTLSAVELQTITPRFMTWDEDTWLLDLTPCLSYWQLQADRQKQTLTQILQKILQQLHPDTAERDEADDLRPGIAEGNARSYYAALSSHPWPALLLVRILEAKGFIGLTSSSQKTARHLFGALSWQMWWDCAERYVQHSPGSAHASFAKHKRAMQLAMRRLACDSPLQLKNMPSSQMRRRFGSLIAQLWEQSFFPSPATPSPAAQTGAGWRGMSSDELTGFPWHAYILSLPLTRTRHLDFPLNDWQVIEPLLREDLNHFCVLDSFKKGERILNLEWRIVLYNLQEIPISVLFRHPHCLQRESPHQRTALLQIFYAFQQTLRSLKERQEEAPWMISWELRILHTLRPLPAQQSLFADERGDWEELMTLENQLKQPLEAYQVREDWLPEDSFMPLSQEKAEESEYGSPLQHMGHHRPLFILQEPQPWTAYGQSLLWKFRERTMDKWWRKQGNSSRDYYQVTSQEQAFWVFRDAKGQCFLHGIYG